MDVASLLRPMTIPTFPQHAINENPLWTVLSEIHPYFTPIELEAFIRVVSPKHIPYLASRLTGYLIENVIIGTIGELHLDNDSRKMLTQAIAEEIANALVSPANLLSAGGVAGTRCGNDTRYVDIAILSENEQGLLTQVNSKLNGQYTDQIQALQDQEENPASSIICRFQIHEHLIKWEPAPEDLVDTECSLGLMCDFLINGKRFHSNGHPMSFGL